MFNIVKIFREWAAISCHYPRSAGSFEVPDAAQSNKSWCQIFHACLFILWFLHSACWSLICDLPRSIPLTSHYLFLWISLFYINSASKSQHGLAADRGGGDFSEEAKRAHRKRACELPFGLYFTQDLEDSHSADCGDQVFRWIFHLQTRYFGSYT